MNRYLLTTALILLGAVSARAHDTWVQTNTAVVRAGDNVHIDLMLGNHGNDHRDFKLASKIGLEGATLQVFAPDGKKYDLKDRLDDIGYTPKEGYWTLRFSGAAPGLYMVAHTSDRVVSYAPTRSVKSARRSSWSARAWTKCRRRIPASTRCSVMPWSSYRRPARWCRWDPTRRSRCA